MLDRFFDNDVSTLQQKIVLDALRPADKRDARGVEDAHPAGDGVSQAGRRPGDRPWAMGQDFSLADCGAVPFLFYGHWTHPIPEAHGRVHAYLDRLLGLASMRHVIDEARPSRSWFPLRGTPPKDALPLD
ncbi:glutathione S-transferase C-terminal domain-containing protein [Luteimonas sp. Y-2-2-4F]|nr:glutathione S-transferase C-terminal domain-containing protein [Luteimonas sp. Y-2-2-4F]MCD9033015.1 glutathione S-transferase C-terminal domain-containing protein [Luteimonas sp. Y-2-2-4F]